MKRIDLEKHGLSHLADRRPSTWTNSEMDHFIEAFAGERLAAIIQIPFTRNTVQALLAMSYCRRCGKCCCEPNPTNPGSPGIAVFDDEMRIIARHSGVRYGQLRRKTAKREVDPGGRTRFIPFPCMFYGEGGCKIYDVRPFICRAYPVIPSGPFNGEVCIDINARCDYGRDLYRMLLMKLKESPLGELPAADRSLHVSDLMVGQTSFSL